MINLDKLKFNLAQARHLYDHMVHKNLTQDQLPDNARLLSPLIEDMETILLYLQRETVVLDKDEGEALWRNLLDDAQGDVKTLKAEVARLRVMLESEKRIAKSWEESANEIAGQREQWKNGCREWTTIGEVGRRRVAQLETALHNINSLIPRYASSSEVDLYDGGANQDIVDIILSIFPKSKDD
jgi:hypothetical protein